MCVSQRSSEALHPEHDRASANVKRKRAAAERAAPKKRRAVRAVAEAPTDEDILTSLQRLRKSHVDAGWKKLSSSLPLDHGAVDPRRIKALMKEHGLMVAVPPRRSEVTVS